MQVNIKKLYLHYFFRKQLTNKNNTLWSFIFYVEVKHKTIVAERKANGLSWKVLNIWDVVIILT